MVDYRFAMMMNCETRLSLRSAAGLMTLLVVLMGCSESTEPGKASEPGNSDPAIGSASSGGDDVTVATAKQAGASTPAVEPLMSYGIEEWYEDFPYPLHVPIRKPGMWYDRNSQEAVEKVVSNLSGLCTKPAWLLSKQFFDRHWDVSRELLVEALDAAQRTHSEYDRAENIVNAMGRCKDGLFADVLLRAAAHSHPGIRTAAFRALGNAGDEASIIKIGKLLPRMTRIEQIEWVKAAARKLSDDKLFPIFRDMLLRQEYAHLQNYAFEESMKLPAARAAKLFEPFWLDLAGDLQLYVAGMMHSIGDGRGTVRLKAALKPPIKILKRKLVAVRGAMLGDTSPFVDELLELTLEGQEGLEVLLVGALKDIPGDNVTDTLITMTDHSKPFLVRQAALRALVDRGVTSEFAGLMETLRTSPRNNKFRDAVADLVAAKYGPAVPVLLQRSTEGTLKEQIFYLRMIGNIGSKEAFTAFKEVFLRPEYRFKGWRERHTNVTFLGVHFSNVKDSHGDMLALLASLPRTEYRRKASLIHALANLAGAYPEEAFVKRVYAHLRKVIYDIKEVPQLRILALDYLRRDIGVADAMKLKRGLPKESASMRKYLSDFLLEFF
jgi:HEAT repeat protein